MPARIKIIRTYLKKKILVPDQGEAKHQSAGIIVYFEDLLRGCNAAMGRKDFFEKGSRKLLLIAAVALMGALVLRPVALKAETNWWEKAAKVLETFNEGAGKNELTSAEIIEAFKELLQIGSDNVVGQLGSLNGFNSDPAIHIPLPRELDNVKNMLGRIGLSSLLEDLELKLNRAAEAATPRAKAPFWNAIKEMTFEDVKTIYKGPDNAATAYFQKKMSEPLAREFRPIVADSLSQVGAILSYDKIMGRYQALPFVPDAKADLTDYVIEKGLDGIFYYLAKEEAAIRKDPAKQTTALLKRVFGMK